MGAKMDRTTRKLLEEHRRIEERWYREWLKREAAIAQRLALSPASKDNADG